MAQRTTRSARSDVYRLLSAARLDLQFALIHVSFTVRAAHLVFRLQTAINQKRQRTSHTVGSLFLPPPFPSLLLCPPSLPPSALIQLWVWGSAVSSPSGSGRIPAAKRILVHFKAKVKHFRALFSCIFNRQSCEIFILSLKIQPHKQLRWRK